LAYTDNGREFTGRDAIAWAEEAVDLGAGELLITSVDREGTGEGFDIELVRTIAERVRVPVVAHGGAGKAADVCEVVNQAGVDAVAIASVLHYNTITQLDNEAATEGEGNYEFISSGRMSKKIKACSIGDVKAALAASSIPCRPIVSHHETCA
jgi:cyclase